MARSVTTFLMFEGAAEAAMQLYVSLFPGSEVLERERRDDGAIQRARIRVGGLELMCFDSPVQHAFGFTPSISLFVECESEDEQAQAFARLADAGQVLMELADHGFSRRFGWVSDRFGVSWQLNLR